MELGCDEYKFYAKLLVENTGLKEDTAILDRQILESERTIHWQERQLDQAKIKSDNKSKIISEQQNMYADLSAKYDKQARKVKFFKRTTLVFMVTTAVLLPWVIAH